MADAHTNGNGGKWVGLYRGAVIILMAAVGYFLQDFGATVKGTAGDVAELTRQVETVRGTINTRAAELQGAIDKVATKVDGQEGRLIRLEQWRDARPR